MLKFWWIVVIVSAVLIVICNALDRYPRGRGKHKPSHGNVKNDELEDLLDWLDEEDGLRDEE